MNKSIGIDLKNLRDNCADYADVVAAIFKDYEIERDGAKAFSGKYKDEHKIYSDMMHKIRNSTRKKIKKAEEQVQSAFAEYALKLEDEWQNSLCKPVPIAFVRQFDIYNNSNLKPSQSELIALCTLSEGHPVAYRLLDDLCEKTHSEYKLKHPSVDEYESDISFCSRLGLLFDYPITSVEQLGIADDALGVRNNKQYHVEHTKPEKGSTTKAEPVGDMLVVDKSETGEKMRRILSDGTVVESGPWTAADLHASQILYNDTINCIGEMIERWSGGAVEVIRQEQDEGVRIATEMGREKAKQAESVIPDGMKQ